MDASEIKRTTFSVSDFLSWQKDGTLELSPPFQRRSVWNEGAKSYLVDTVSKGLPTPLIFIRDQIDLDALKHRREVIDGQQRLRRSSPGRSLGPVGITRPGSHMTLRSEERRHFFHGGSPSPASGRPTDVY